MLKKLLAVLLVVVMLFSFAACQGSESGGVADALISEKIEKDDILGVWKSEVKMSDMLASDGDDEDDAVSRSLAAVKSDATIDYYIEFKENNVYDIKYKADNFKAALKTHYQVWIEDLKKDKDTFIEITGLDEETLNLVLSTMTFEEFVDQTGVEMIKALDTTSIEELLDSASLEDDVVVVDGFVVDKGYKYEIDGKKINLQVEKDEEGDATMFFKDGKLSFEKFIGFQKNPDASVFKNGFTKVE